MQKGKGFKPRLRVGEIIDTIISHNEIVSLWYEVKTENEDNYKRLLWSGMAWDIPEEYKELEFVRIFGIIPESIVQADIINILLKGVING